MLNTEQLAQYIDQPELIRFEDVETLRELAEKHPYSSTYSLLYLQGVSRYQSIHLDEILPQQAYKLSDRTRLYHLLHTAYESNSVVEEINSLDQKIMDVVHVQELVKESIAEEQNAEVEELVELEQEMPVETPVEPVSEPISQPLIEESPVQVTEEQAEKSIFDFDMVAETLGQDFLEIRTKEESIDQEEKVVPQTTEPSLVQLAEELEQTYPQELANAKRSFTSWLKASHSKVDVKKVEEPEQKISSQEIIDQFIEKSPSMPKPQSEFFSPSKKAKESIDENRIPVSETLAKIFAAQGNFPKAIHVYHQLILAFPEKKSLFALQIEELKKKITS